MRVTLSPRGWGCCNRQVLLDRILSAIFVHALVSRSLMLLVIGPYQGDFGYLADSFDTTAKRTEVCLQQPEDITRDKWAKVERARCWAKLVVTGCPVRYYSKALWAYTYLRIHSAWVVYTKYTSRRWCTVECAWFTSLARDKTHSLKWPNCWLNNCSRKDQRTSLSTKLKLALIFPFELITAKSSCRGGREIITSCEKDVHASHRSVRLV